MIQQAFATSTTESSSSYLLLGPMVPNHQNDQVKVIGDGKRRINSAEVNLVEGNQVKIAAHGNYNDVNGYIVGLLSHSNVFKDWSRDLNQSVNIEIFGCYAGGAIRDLDAVPQGSTIITTVGHQKQAWIDIHYKLLEKSFDFVKSDNPFVAFASYIYANPNTNQFGVNLGSIPSSLYKNYYDPFARDEFVNTFHQPGGWSNHGIFISPIEDLLRSHDLSTEAIKKWQDTRLDEFTKFVDNIKGKVPQAMREQISEFKETVTQEWKTGFNTSQFQQILPAISAWHQLDYENYKLLASISQEDLTLKMTLLQRAAFRGNIKFVEKLVDEGFDMNATDNAGRNLLHYVATNGAETNSNEPSAIEVLKFLVDKGLDVNAGDADKKTPLHYAAEYKFFKSIDFFVANGANINAPDSDGNTPLHLAAREGYSIATDEFIKNGADVRVINNNGWTPLHYAVNGIKGDEIFSVLSSRQDRIKVIDSLFKNGVDINAVDKDGWSALYTAAMNGNTEVVKILVKAGADINAVDNNGWSALYTAAMGGNTEVVKILVKAGADIHAVTNYGSSALELAAMYGYTEVVKALVDNRADIHAVTNYGSSALELAVGNNHIEAAQIIIKEMVNENTNIFKYILEKNDPKLIKFVLDNKIVTFSNGERIRLQQAISKNEGLSI